MNKTDPTKPIYSWWVSSTCLLSNHGHQYTYNTDDKDFPSFNTENPTINMLVFIVQLAVGIYHYCRKILLCFALNDQICKLIAPQIYQMLILHTPYTWPLTSLVCYSHFDKNIAGFNQFYGPKQNWLFNELIYLLRRNCFKWDLP